MAEKTARVNLRRLSQTINRIHRKVNSISVDAEEWGEFSEMEQMDYSIEWDNDLGTIDLLEISYRAGEFTRDQAKAYTRLKDDLRRALPILDRLELSKPPSFVLR